MKLEFFVNNFTSGRKVYSAICDMLTTGNAIDVVLKEHANRRSTQQNSFYWLNCKDIADFLNDSGLLWDNKFMFSDQIIHEMNKQIFGIETTTKMNVKEFCEYMNKIFEYWRNKTNNFWQEKESTVGYIERTGLINEIQND